jgi:hypothetical protein
MFMAAFEAMPLVAEQQRARRKDCRTQCRTILKRSVRHRGDTRGIVPFFKRTILRTGGADDVVDAPAGSKSQES